MQEMRFSSNEGQRLAFEDMNAMAKCELFSRKGNTSFPPDVKCSLLPNLDTLGAPIGDYLHCSKFIAGKCAESRKLLSGLVDVAAVNLQAQLGLKFGGLGLRSVSLHAAAAFIASLASSGFGSADYIHLQQAVVAFNSQVSVPNAISVISVLASPTPTQKVLSGMIENQLFSTLLESSSHANRARLLPADILIAGWDRGKPAALDITITSPLCPAILGESCQQAGAAVLAAEARKLHSNGPKCQELGWSCIPLAVETYGNWGKEAHDTISRLASHLAIHQSSPKSSVVAEIYGRLNMTLVRSIARAILARELPPP
eukprot:Em0006g425a